MDIEVLLTPHVWLQAKPDVRHEIAKAFGLSSTGTPRCITKDGQTRIESDGYTIDDLRPLNAVSMQKALGFSNIDASADINALFSMVADVAERKLRPPKAEPTDPQPAIAINEGADGTLEVTTADKPPKAKKKL